ncbi:MAG: hypothetical protein WCI72_01370 [archaeon]
MVKKRSSREVIESAKKPKCERIFYRYPTGETTDVTDYKRASKYMAIPDEDKVVDFMGTRKGEEYSMIHTHQSEIPLGPLEKAFRWMVGSMNVVHTANQYAAIPSGGDIFCLMDDPNIRSIPLAVTDTKTGKLLGYNVIVKTKKCDGKFRAEDLDKYDAQSVLATGEGDPAIIRNAYESLLKKYGLKSRMVPAEGYRVNEYNTSFVKKDSGGLESQASVSVALIAFIGSLFFTTSNLTGNAIGNLSSGIANLLGIILFLIGITGTYFYAKKNN